MQVTTNKQINIQLDDNEVLCLLEILERANDTGILTKEAKQLSLDIEIAIGAREDY